MLHDTTLYDLDIVAPPNGHKKSLWDEVNQCRTAGGKEELRNILSLKEHSLQHTLKRQQAIAYLSTRVQKVHFSVTENEVYYLHHYLDSNFSIDESRTKLMLAVKSYAKLLTAKTDYLYVLSGVKQAYAIIKHIKDIYELLAGMSAPELLKQIFGTMGECLSKLYSNDTFGLLNHEPDPVSLYNTDRQLRLKEKDNLLLLLQCYYRLEALCSLAKAHASLQLVFPEIGQGLIINTLRHPLVKGCVPCDVALSVERLLLVTGPNMAGKSTYLKSMGLAFVMAYAGMGVAAAYAQLPFYRNIITSINTEDDIGSGYSYFYNEVRKVKEMALALKVENETLIIADELFKGTNVKDAGDCTATVIKGLLKQNGGLYLLATHLVETVTEFEGHPGCRLLCFDGRVEGDKIQFDYRIAEGISSTTLGRHKLEAEHIPELFGL